MVGYYVWWGSVCVGGGMLWRVSNVLSVWFFSVGGTSVPILLLILHACCYL